LLGTAEADRVRFHAGTRVRVVDPEHIGCQRADRPDRDAARVESRDIRVEIGDCRDTLIYVDPWPKIANPSV